jgi:Flp pilus assembly protein protease CpaA
MYLLNNQMIIVAIYMGGAVILDIKTRKVPNIYILCGMLFAFFSKNITTCFTQMILICILLLPLYGMQIIGAADVKLACVIAGGISALLAMQIVINALLITAFAAGIIKFYYVLIREKIKFEKFPFTLPLLLALLHQMGK